MTDFSSFFFKKSVLTCENYPVEREEGASHESKSHNGRKSSAKSIEDVFNV